MVRDRFHDRLTSAGGDRLEALRTTLNEYREQMHTNEPVHTWELTRATRSPPAAQSRSRAHTRPSPVRASRQPVRVST